MSEKFLSATQTNKQLNKQTNKQKNKQTNKQTNIKPVNTVIYSDNKQTNLHMYM